MMVKKKETAKTEKEPLLLTFNDGKVIGSNNESVDLENLTLLMSVPYFHKDRSTVAKHAYSIAVKNKCDYYLVIGHSTEDFIATSSLSKVTGIYGPRIEDHTSLNIDIVNFYKKRE